VPDPLAHAGAATFDFDRSRVTRPVAQRPVQLGRGRSTTRTSRAGSPTWDPWALDRNGQDRYGGMSTPSEIDEEPVGPLVARRPRSGEQGPPGPTPVRPAPGPTVLEANVDGQVTIDPLGVVVELNRRMEELTGLSREQLVGAPFKGAFVEPSRAEQALRRVQAEGRVSGVELTVRSRGGAESVLSFNLATVRGSTGAAWGILATARDVTEQRQLEAQLRESQTYNRGLIEASPDALLTVDPNLTILDVNEQMVRISGFTRKQLIGSSFLGLFADPAPAEHGVRLSLENRRVTNYETLLRKQNGLLVPISFNAGTFYDMTGTVRGTLVAVRDITEFKRIEADLRESQNYNRNLVESNIDALMTTDVLGIITDVNRQMEALTGRTRLAIIGTPFPDYFTDPARAEDAIRRALREDRLRDYELTVRAGPGRGVSVSFNAATLRDGAGRLKGVFAAARDVTEQKHLRNELEQRNRELEVQNHRVREADRLKSEFLANMSHELRTPLNSIIGFSEFLISDTENGLTAQQRDQVGDIYLSGVHLLQLINDVLDLAKVEAGKLDLFPEPVSLRAALTEACALVKPMVDQKQLALRWELAEGLDPVTLDALRFKQVLLNLLSNAVKFTGPGGRIDLSVAPVDRDRFVLRVRDTGIGISPENVARLFRQFEQLDAGPGRRYPGSGLGLSLTKKIVELMDGTIDVQSEVGRGTTFTVVLPVVLRVPDG
jgi:PAS domain S-box-containing protein